MSVLDGRFIDTDVSNFKGGSFNYNSYPNRSGTYLEKPLASKALAAQFPPMHVYYSRDTYVDGRNMLINFRSFMPVAYDRLMSGVFAFDLDAVAPYIDRSKATKAGDYVVEPQYQKLWRTPTRPRRAPTPSTSTRWSASARRSPRCSTPSGSARTMAAWRSPRCAPGFRWSLVCRSPTRRRFFYEPDSGVLWACGAVT